MCKVKAKASLTNVNLFGLDKFPLVADDVCKNPRLCI